ncbi:hypothetical protein quinque_001831 [Culex quinquefasciatus]
MNPDFVEIVPPRQLRRSPERGQPSGLRPPSRITAPQSRLRPPSGTAPPPATGIRPPSASGLRPPGGLRPPSTVRTIGEVVPPKKVIPLPGPSGVQKLAAIPKPVRPPGGIPKLGHARIVLPVARAASTSSLLPKPSFLQAPKINLAPVTPKRPPGHPVPQVPRTPKAVPRLAPKTPVMLPRTAVKQRIVSEDPSAETYNIAGREVEFVDYEDSPQKVVRRGVVPRPLPMDSPESPDSLWSSYVPWKPSQFLLDMVQNVPDSPPKQRYVSEENPTAEEIRLFHEKIRADLERSRKLVADMQEFYDRKSADLQRIKAMVEEEDRLSPEQKQLNLEAFRERYGVTQSPKMRQLLEVTGEWNRDILERREFEERVAKAGTFVRKERIRRVPTLESVRESEEGSPMSDVRRLQIEQARLEKIDEHKQRIQVQQEYQRLMEDRKRNIASRRPYSKQEREEIRKRYQEAQEWTYTALTEEELDAALKRAEMLELEEEGVSMQDSPKKIVEALFPDAAPSAEISGIACDVLIPSEIPVDKMNTMNSLDHSTAEIALKASSIPAPAEDAAKKILADSLHQMATTVIEARPTPPPLDPLYEIDLKLDRPKRQNYIQLQGSTPPAWFPGFYAVFPGAPGLVQATKSPSSTLLTAWRKMQPSIAAAI